MSARVKVERTRYILLIPVSLLWWSLLPMPTLAQPAAEKMPHAKAGKEVRMKLGELDSNEQRRAFAISLVLSLADEARSYHEVALRPRVLARAGDTLWDVDRDAARQLFRRAWESAEKGDADEATITTKDNPPQMVVALRRMGGTDLRSEVLGIVARRDQNLAEDFLAKLKNENEREANSSKSNASTRRTDSWSSPETASKRLQVASRLLESGQIQSALEFAEPALDQVNANSIGFLSALRVKSPEAADAKFALLLARAELDPRSDANTASGLSSYAFTPGFYVTFSAEGGATWRRGDSVSVAPPDLPAALRNRFFQVTGNLLMRPLLPPDQDFTSSGRVGKYMAVKRLLPLFDQYMPETASSLRGQLTELANDPLKRGMGEDSSLLGMGLRPAESPGTTLEKMQSRLDHAKTSRERDSIYTEGAVALANQRDPRAQDVAANIDDADLRAEVLQFVNFEFLQGAIKGNKAMEVVRFAKAGELTHIQRAWAFTQAARLVMKSEPPRALEFLGEAADEARRITDNDSYRALALIGVAKQFVDADRVRAWETMGEAVKAANSADEFTGENPQITFSVATRSGVKFSSFGGEDFRISGVLRLLMNVDLYRSIDLAKSFKNDAPRANATLAIARAVLEK